MPFSSKNSSDSLNAIQEMLDNLVGIARRSFENNLQSIILFGSGAEGRLRATSDLNLLFVLTQYNKTQVDSFREPLCMLSATRRARVMFLLTRELTQAVDAFAVKFDDMMRRRRVIYGQDVLAHICISRQARKQRLCQMLLNLTLRLREQYAMLNCRQERLAGTLAETAGPLRSAAATLMELEGQEVISPKEALESWVCRMNEPAWQHTLNLISQARETFSLSPAEGASAMFQLTALVQTMLLRAERLE